MEGRLEDVPLKSRRLVERATADAVWPIDQKTRKRIRRRLRVLPRMGNEYEVVPKTRRYLRMNKLWNVRPGSGMSVGNSSRAGRTLETSGKEVVKDEMLAMLRGEEAASNTKDWDHDRGLSGLPTAQGGPAPAQIRVEVYSADGDIETNVVDAQRDVTSKQTAARNWLDEEFEGLQMGFPTERRPQSYRRQLESDTAREEAARWVSQYPKIVGDYARTEEQKARAALLLYTWRDLFVTEVMRMPQTDLVEHRIPTVPGHIPRAASLPLYSEAELSWQRKHLPLLVEHGIIVRCNSPYMSRTKFPPKESGGLRMVHNYIKLNDVTIKTNYPLRRMEPILNDLAKKKSKCKFQADGTNGYWGIGTYGPHQYKAAFSSALGQFTYTRMGQGLTGACGTYARYKDIMTGYIPAPNEEPELAVCSPEVAFGHFQDDDFGGAPDFDRLFDFLHYWYFPRVAWAIMSLNPKKCHFFVSEVGILGHHAGCTGMRPSAKRVSAFANWPPPNNDKELYTFLYQLPYVMRFIPGRADWDRIMRTAIIQEVQEYKDNGRKRKVTRNVDFRWNKRHQQAFDAARKAAANISLSGGDREVQYHLAADASKTGAGGVLFQLPTVKPGVAIREKDWDDVQFVMFMSFAFTPAETRYTTTEREALALLKCLMEVRWLVVGNRYPVLTYTDHSSLLSVLRSDDGHGRIARWQLKFGEYWLDVKHVPGKTLIVADGLSRIRPEHGYRQLYEDEEDFPITDLIPEDHDEAAQAKTARESYRNTRPAEDREMSVVVAPVERDVLSPEPQDLEDDLSSQLQDLGPGWEHFNDDEWYSPIIQFKTTGRVGPTGLLDASLERIIKRAARKVILIDNSEADPPRPNELGYTERNGKIAKCIRENEVPLWLEELHDVHGHWSERITASRAIGVVWWPSRSQDIYKFCRSCAQCQFVGPLRPSQGLLPILFLQPMDCGGMDYIGPFTPIARSGARYILIYVDYFSRYIFACPVKAAISANSWWFLWHYIITTFGHPRVLYTDNGSHFVKGVFPEMLKRAAVRHVTAPITHPSSVGLAESTVRLVLGQLRKRLQANPDAIFEWDMHVAPSVNEINTRFMRVQGFTPAQLLFGWEPRYASAVETFEDQLRSSEIHIRIAENLPMGDQSLEEAVYTAHMAAVDETRDLAARRLFENQKNVAVGSESRVDSARQPMAGDAVLLRRLQQDKQHAHKLEPKWEGPYLLASVSSKGKSGRLKTLDSGSLKGVYHLNDMKVFVRREDRLQPGPGIDIPANNYEVTQRLKAVAREQKALRQNAKRTLDGILMENPAGTDPDLVDNGEIHAPVELRYPEGFGDEGWDYWREREVNLQRLLGLDAMRL